MIVAARLILLLILSCAGYCIYRGVTDRPRWLWYSALALYLLALPFAMSIGVFLLAPAMMSAGAALMSTLRAGDSRFMALGAAVALGIWSLWYAFGDITWAFYPPFALFGAVS